MTKKTLEELQVAHSEMCARAADGGVKVPEELTVDFDTAEAGAGICEQLEKLLADAGVAEDPEVVQDATSESKPKKTKKAKTKLATQERDTTQQESDTMAKSAKKSVSKKTAKKSVAKKKVAKKSAAKKGAKVKKAKVARTDSKTAWVIGKLKNGGVTRAQILEKTGWKAVSVQALAKAAGLKLKVSEERPFTYKAA